MSCIGTRVFSGKRYTFFSVQHSKKKAEKMIRQLRAGGMSTRLVREREAGKIIYQVFCRFKDSKVR